jgi:hypothetical protein
MSRLSIYDKRNWRDRTSKNVRAYNPICQRLHEDGKQCEKPSNIVHHLIDPKDAPEKAHDWSILVATCTAHHAGGQRGETQGARYCATIGPHTIHYHGIHVLPAWHDDYKPLPETSITRLGGTTTTAVGSAAIDAALGEWA